MDVMLIMLSLLLTAVYLRVGEGPGAGHAVLHGPRHHREQHQVRLLVTRQLLPAVTVVTWLLVVGAGDGV